MTTPSPSPPLQTLLSALQAFHVAVLWLHDWLPLGRLNDVAAVRREIGSEGLLRITLVQALPWSVGLAGCCWFAGISYPGWLWGWVWVSHVVLLAGELRAWWWPYLFRPDPARAERYRRMFGRTHTALPLRHGMAPNTLHMTLHLTTLSIVLVLIATAVAGPPRAPT